MGRRDAVQVTLEVIARMRQLEPRLIVSYEPGWETRGNGTSANYEGGLVHHTASASSLAKPFPTQGTLRNGRPDLSGPLCNEAGPACTVEQPRIHVMAANPANHAGASGGRSMGPLPVTSLFNPRVRGLEIDYAGTVPMLAGQLYVAHLWARANADVVGGGDINRIRAHFETSVTGKWDIGFAPGKSYDMALFRRDAAAIIKEDDMPLTDDDVQKIWSYMLWRPSADPAVPVAPMMAGHVLAYADNTAAQTLHAVVDQSAALASQVAELQQQVAAPAAAGVAVKVDSAAVAAALAKDTTFLAGLAKAVNDDAARRLAS